MIVPIDERQRSAPTSARRLAIAAAVVIATLLVAWTAFVPFYDTNDDTVMRLIAEGRAVPGAPPEARLLFMNALVGLVVVTLNSTVAGWPWYDLVLGGIQVLAAVTMIVALLGRRSLAHTVALAALVATFWIPTFVRLQFTVVAGQAAAAGCVLMGEMLIARGVSRRFLITRGVAAVALIVLGAVVRWQAAVLVVALAGALALPLAWAASGAARRGVIVTALTVLVAAAVLIGVVNEFDRRYYAAAAGWTEFQTAHRLRGLLTEWLPRTPDTEAQLAAARAAAGWSVNDVEMLRTRFHTNLDTFGRHRLEPAVQSLQEAARTTTVLGYAPDAVPEVIKGTLQGMWGQFSYALAFVLLAGAAWLRPSVLLYALYSAAVLLATVVMTSLMFKEVPYRLLWPLLTVQAAFLLLSADDAGPRGRAIAAAICIALVSILPVRAALRDLRVRSDVLAAHAHKVVADVAALAPAPRRIYVIHGASFTYQAYFRPLAPSPPADAFAFLPLAATSQTPLVQDYLRREGIRDVALSLCTEDRFRLISDRDLQPIQTYVAEHFAQTVTIAPELKGQTFTSFRCTRAPDGPTSGGTEP